MGTFLQVLGFIFLAIILFLVAVVVGGRFFLKRRLKQFAQQVEEVQRRQNANVYDYDDVKSQGSRREDVNVIDVEVNE